VIFANQILQLDYQTARRKHDGIMIIATT